MFEEQLKELINNIPWLVLIVFYNIVFYSISFFFVCLINQKFILHKSYSVILKKIAYGFIGLFFGMTSFLSNYIWTLLADQIKTNLFNNYNAWFVVFNDLIQLFIIFIYASQTSFFIMLFASIGYFASIFFYTTLNLNFILILLIAFVCFISFLFFYRLFTPNKKKTFFIYFFLNLLIIFIWQIFLFETTEDFILIYSLTNALYILCLFVVFYLSLQIVETISNTSELQTSIYYDNFFIKEWYARTAFEKYVKLKKINYGCIFLINFKNLEYVCRKEGGNKIRYLKKNIIEKFKEALKDDVLYLKGSNDEFYFFLEFKNRPDMEVILKGNNLDSRLVHDPLYKIDNIVKKIPQKIINKKQIINFNLNLYASIYGINSNSFDCLINDLSLINEQKTSVNKIIVFHPIKNFYIYEIDDKANLNKIINFDSIKIDFVEKDHLINSVVHIYNTDFSNYYAIKKHDILTYDNLITLSRYLAFKILEQYALLENQNSILNLYYPLDFMFSDNFKIDYFISKIITNNIDPKKINLNLFIINRKAINKKAFFLLKKQLEIFFHNVDLYYSV